jgi:hypothetical protein
MHILIKEQKKIAAFSRNFTKACTQQLKMNGRFALTYYYYKIIYYNFIFD